MLYIPQFSIYFCLGYLLLFCKISNAVKQSWEINQELITEANKEHTVFGDMRELQLRRPSETAFSVLTPAQLIRYENSKDSDLSIRGVSIKGSSMNRWSNNIVPYVISPQYSPAQ